MPSRPPKVCAQSGCAARTTETYCIRHKKKPKRIDDKKRGSSSSRGYGSRWQKARRTYLLSHPLCADCEQRGLTVQAQVVDHRKPHKGDQALFWDQDNWQGLCIPCHNRKTASQDGGFGNKQQTGGG